MVSSSKISSNAKPPTSYHQLYRNSHHPTPHCIIVLGCFPFRFEDLKMDSFTKSVHWFKNEKKKSFKIKGLIWSAIWISARKVCHVLYLRCTGSRPTQSHLQSWVYHAHAYATHTHTHNHASRTHTHKTCPPTFNTVKLGKSSPQSGNVVSPTSTPCIYMQPSLQIHRLLRYSTQYSSTHFHALHVLSFPHQLISHRCVTLPASWEHYLHVFLPRHVCSRLMKRLWCHAVGWLTR